MTELVHNQIDGRGSSRDVDPRATHDEAGRAHDAWEASRALFEKAADDPNAAARAGTAHLTVRISALDIPSWAFIVDLNDGMSVFDDHGESVDVEIGIGTADLERLAAGHLRMAMAIANGRATYDGPVRQFLRVLPVIQALARPAHKLKSEMEAI